MVYVSESTMNDRLLCDPSCRCFVLPPSPLVVFISFRFDRCDKISRICLVNIAIIECIRLRRSSNTFYPRSFVAVFYLLASKNEEPSPKYLFFGPSFTSPTNSREVLLHRETMNRRQGVYTARFETRYRVWGSHRQTLNLRESVYTARLETRYRVWDSHRQTSNLRESVYTARFETRYESEARTSKSSTGGKLLHATDLPAWRSVPRSRSFRDPMR